MKNTLAQLRQAQNLTQEDLAIKLGVSRQTIISIEREKFSPSLSLAFRIAQFFDSNIHEIFEAD